MENLSTVIFPWNHDDDEDEDHVILQENTYVYVQHGYCIM